MASQPPAMTDWGRSQAREGHCAMRGSCGKKSIISTELPCPYDGPASEVGDLRFVPTMS